MNFVVAVNNFGDTRSGGLAGPMGLFIIVLLSVATVLLIRGMNKRIRRLPDSFQDAGTDATDAELARIEAELNRPVPGTTEPAVDRDRSPSSGLAASTEVSGADAADGRKPRRGKAKPA